MKQGNQQNKINIYVLIYVSSVFFIYFCLVIDRDRLQRDINGEQIES